MLTAEWVRVRRSGNELFLVPLARPTKKRALEMAEELIAIVHASSGRSREEVLAALEAVPAGVRERKIKGGLVKLLLDRVTFGAESAVEPERLREAVFTLASARRAEDREGRAWNREEVVAEVAREQAITVETLEACLFADLPSAQRITGFDAISPEALLSAYERGQVQAVLLRASEVTVEIRSSSALAGRAVLNRIKFLQLLFTASPIERGYRLVIDGPMSLFESATRYGRKIAQIVPMLEGCEEWQLEARVHWARGGPPLVFRAEAEGEPSEFTPDLVLRPEAATLVESFARLDTGWEVGPSTVVLNVPGVGLAVPDLVFERAGTRVYLEIMGYWSRDAVFRRIDLVDRGLSERMIFAVSEKLRVCEEALGEHPSAALYVYRTSMSARSVAERLERLARVEASAR